MTRCPLCSTAAPEGAAECPSCGAIFAKLRARAEREKNAALRLPEPTPAPSVGPWQVRLAALAVVALWMLALGLYYRVELRRHPPRAGSGVLQGRASAAVRDASGRLVEVPVHSARPGASRREEPAPPPAAEPSRPDPFDE